MYVCQRFAKIRKGERADLCLAGVRHKFDYSLTKKSAKFYSDFTLTLPIGIGFFWLYKMVAAYMTTPL